MHGTDRNGEGPLLRGFGSLTKGIDRGKHGRRRAAMPKYSEALSAEIPAKARAEGRIPGREPILSKRRRECIQGERLKGMSQQELAKLLEVNRWTIQQVDR